MASNNRVKQSSRSLFNYARYNARRSCATTERQTAVARKRDARRGSLRCTSVYCRLHTFTHARELHTSDKYTPRMHCCCRLWSSSPPPGNNSKSRVINPSPLYLPSLPPHPSLSSPVCTRVCVCVCICAYVY